jgi:hypothetical protein
MHSIFHVGAWALPDFAAFHSISTRCFAAVRLNAARNAPDIVKSFEMFIVGGELPVEAPVDDPLEVKMEFGSTNGWIQALVLE